MGLIGLVESETQEAAVLSYIKMMNNCLLYTSDAADERSSVDLGGRRIIKKKKWIRHTCQNMKQMKTYSKSVKSGYTAGEH